jgi:hypothetical protein
MGTDTDEESATNTDKERRRAQHRAERLRTHEEDFGPEKNFFIKTTHSAAERPVFRLLLAPLPSSEKNYIFFWRLNFTQTSRGDLLLRLLLGVFSRSLFF